MSEPTRVELGKYVADCHKLNGWTLCQRVVRTDKKTGETKPDLEDIGYYGTMQGVAHRLVELEVSNLGTITGRQFLQAVTEATDRVEELFQGVTA